MKTTTGPPGRQPVGEAQPVEAGHLDVEEDDVRPVALDGRARRQAVAALADGVHLRVRIHDAGHGGAGERLVVDDENAELRHPAA